MPNLKHAKEWIYSADKSLETAILLNRENHYTDVIAIDIQQAVEKSLKSLYAYLLFICYTILHLKSL